MASIAEYGIDDLMGAFEDESESDVDAPDSEAEMADEAEAEAAELRAMLKTTQERLDRLTAAKIGKTSKALADASNGAGLGPAPPSKRLKSDPPAASSGEHRPQQAGGMVMASRPALRPAVEVASGKAQNEHRRSDIPALPTAVTAPGKAPSSRTYNDRLEEFSKLGIKNRTVSTTEMKTRMSGRRLVKVGDVASTIKKTGGLDDEDWVVIGVLSSKSVVKKSSKGESFSVWALSDLGRGEVGVFLFGSVFAAHWKEQEGTIIALLNPSVMPPRDGDKGKDSGRTSLSLASPGNLMKLGTSTDLGFCAGTRHDGVPCNKPVNKTQGEYCEYHVGAAYRMMKKTRMELGSSVAPRTKQFGGGGIGKVGGTAAGKKTIWTSKTLAKRAASVPISEEFSAKQSSNGLYKRTVAVLAGGTPKPLPGRSDGSFGPTRKDALGISREKGTTAAGQILLTTAKRGEAAPVRPTLGRGLFNGREVVLVSGAGAARVGAGAAQARAVATIRSQGGIHRTDPNDTSSRPRSMVTMAAAHPPLRATGTKSASNGAREGKLAGKLRSSLAKAIGVEAIDLKSTDGKQLLSAKSGNAAVHDAEKAEILERKFDQGAKLEAMEAKMAEIMEQKVKCYRCADCNAFALGKQKFCTERNHKVERGTGTKRFFSCKSCNRHKWTINERMPRNKCEFCGCREFTRTSMLREKRDPVSESQELQITAPQQGRYIHPPSED